MLMRKHSDEQSNDWFRFLVTIQWQSVSRRKGELVDGVFDHEPDLTVHAKSSSSLAPLLLSSKSDSWRYESVKNWVVPALHSWACANGRNVKKMAKRRGRVWVILCGMKRNTNRLPTSNSMR